MQRPDLAAHPRFATAAYRVANVAALDAVIADWTRDQDAPALTERLQVAGVPAGTVQVAPDLLADPHLTVRGFYQSVEHPEVGATWQDTLPLRWTDGPVPIRFAAPLLGEYTEYVLRELLGLSEDEYVELIVNDVV